MPDKDVDEQFAAMMAHWDEEALGLDPFGDPDRQTDHQIDDETSDERHEIEDSLRSDVTSAPRHEVAGLDIEELERLADLDERDERGTRGQRAPRDPRHELDHLEQGFDFPITPPPGPSRQPDLPPHQVPDFSGFVIDLGRTLGGPDQSPGEPAAPTDDGSGTTSSRGPGVGRGTGWRQHDVPDVEEHFVPPPPAPLPSADDKHFWLMVVGLVGGPLLFLYLILFARDGHGWLMVFAIAVTVAGFVLLVLRQPFERDEDDHGIRL